jgi:hypothetical protein
MRRAPSSDATPVPAWVDVQRWESLERVWAAVEAMPSGTPRELEALCDAWEQIERQLADAAARLRLWDAADRRAVAYRMQLDRLIRDIEPRCAPYRLRLADRLRSAPPRLLTHGLRGVAAAQQERRWRHAPAVVPLIASLEESQRRWAEISAACVPARLVWEAARTSFESDRREQAWQALVAAHWEVSPALEQLWEEQEALRLLLAQQAGLERVEALAAQEAGRAELVAAVASCCEAVRGQVRLPLMVDPPPAPWTRDRAWGAPGETPHIDALAADCVEAARIIGGERLAGQAAQLVEWGDLEARPNKALGAMTLVRPQSMRPVLFVHPLGRFEDGLMLLHELGHGLQLMNTAPRWWGIGPHMPLAAQEVCAMGFEHVGARILAMLPGPHQGYWRAVHGWQDTALDVALCRFAARAAFERWLYGAREASAGLRHEVWAHMQRMFGPQEDEEGLPWTAESTFFLRPFYALDYALALLQVRQHLTLAPPSALARVLAATPTGSWSAWCAQMGWSADFG